MLKTYKDVLSTHQISPWISAIKDRYLNFIKEDSAIKLKGP